MSYLDGFANLHGLLNCKCEDGVPIRRGMGAKSDQISMCELGDFCYDRRVHIDTLRPADATDKSVLVNHFIQHITISGPQGRQRAQIHLVKTGVTLEERGPQKREILWSAKKSFALRSQAL
jgi:hypothetical protein